MSCGQKKCPWSTCGALNDVFLLFTSSTIRLMLFDEFVCEYTQMIEISKYFCIKKHSRGYSTNIEHWDCAFGTVPIKYIAIRSRCWCNSLTGYQTDVNDPDSLVYLYLTYLARFLLCKYLFLYTALIHFENLMKELSCWTHVSISVY